MRALSRLVEPKWGRSSLTRQMTLKVVGFWRLTVFCLFPFLRTCCYLRIFNRDYRVYLREIDASSRSLQELTKAVIEPEETTGISQVVWMLATTTLVVELYHCIRPEACCMLLSFSTPKFALSSPTSFGHGLNALIGFLSSILQHAEQFLFDRANERLREMPEMQRKT